MGRIFTKYMMITIKAPAKINLCLHIIGRRPDGYHELETIMQAVDIYDEISIQPAAGFSFSCSDNNLQNDNLVEKAAQAFYRLLGKEPTIHIHLHKRIPHGAGLGGGSSDAAATLLGLNRLHDNLFNYNELWEIARTLGADVPFFLSKGTALCSGIGEQVKSLPGFPLADYLLVKPPLSISTAAVYEKLHTNGLQFQKPVSKISSLCFREYNISSILYNDLEQPALAFYPELLTIKDDISALGADGVLMSGSGSAVFGLFADQDHCLRAARLLAEEKPDDWWIAACKATIADYLI